MLKKELLDMICCPKCKSPLVYDVDRERLTCTSCKRTYPVKNDIPILLVDDGK